MTEKLSEPALRTDLDFGELFIGGLWRTPDGLSAGAAHLNLKSTHLR